MKYHTNLGSLCQLIDRIEGGRPTQITEVDRLTVQVIIAERLEALVEKMEEISRILEGRR